MRGNHQVACHFPENVGETDVSGDQIPETSISR
jgi:hypothetical protein